MRWTCALSVLATLVLIALVDASVVERRGRLLSMTAATSAILPVALSD